jgi:hypothetical protein
MGQEEDMEDEASMMMDSSGFVSINDADMQDFSPFRHSKRCCASDSMSYEIDKLRSENSYLVRQLDIHESRIEELESACSAIMSSILSNDSSWNLTKGISKKDMEVIISACGKKISNG